MIWRVLSILNIDVERHLLFVKTLCMKVLARHVKVLFASLNHLIGRYTFKDLILLLEDIYESPILIFIHIDILLKLLLR